MSEWVEERCGGERDHIFERAGLKFVVRRVPHPNRQLPPSWRIKDSPFWRDEHKKFSDLSEAKAYCESRYNQLNGQFDEITRLRADLAAVTAERDRMRARSVLIPESVQKIIDDYPAVCAERDRMREAVRAESERAYNEGRASRRAVVVAGHALFIYAQKAANKIKRHSLEKLFPSPDDELLAFIRAVDESSKSDSVRAALEGVTEPASHKGPDENLNLRNAECLPSTAAVLKPETPKGNNNGNQ